ncbi:MAG TPA: TRAM domain-containing protein [Kofleriaceae bacterium]|nr:TRAM domain-containing protein [Kofleriaceae bacterium]
MSEAKRSEAKRSGAGPGSVVELEITALAAGGDGVGRDAAGRVTFVPRTAPGDRVRARIVHATRSLARAELASVLAPSPARVPPPCPHFLAGCGGCAWQHVARPEQLAAKQAIVAGALRKLPGLTVHPIADPAPPLGWRRRARFHVAGGRVGLFALGTHRVLPIAACPQLEPALDAARAVVAAASPPDGELALLAASPGGAPAAAVGAPACAVGVEAPWAGAARLVGRAGIRGVIAGGAAHGAPILELEPGLHAGPWDFAQASAAGNAALIARVLAAVGPPPESPESPESPGSPARPGARRLLELYAGGGNLTRALAAAGWDVLASDVAPASSSPASPAPPAPLAPPPPWAFERGTAADVLARAAGPFGAIVLDPPRTGAPDALDGILRHAPAVIVYVSCDAATLARDAARLVAGGYRATDAWPIDLMPQTAHVEVVLRLETRR